MADRCDAADCDPVHYDPGCVRVFLLWIGGERVACRLCEPCAARYRVDEALDPVVVRGVVTLGPPL